MLTALATAPVKRRSAICSAICRATFSCASLVAAPRCGVQMTLGRPNSGLSLAGSTSNTSKAAPPTRFQHLGQRPLVDQAAARAIDDAYALLGFLERGGIDDVAGLVGERGVQ